MIRLLIADDHAVFADGIGALLAGTADIKVVSCCYSVPMVLDTLAREPVDVILLDLSFPQLTDGLALCEQLAARHPALHVIALTMHDDVSVIQRIFRQGAKGYVLKNTTRTELIQAVRTVYQGQPYVSPSLHPVMLAATAADQAAGRTTSRPTLTSREADVLLLLRQGLSTQQIAHQLCTSADAVDFHRSSLLMKFNVPTVPQLVQTLANAVNTD
ncbi:response regulator transcription factor [Spirosoma luteolum]